MRTTTVKCDICGREIVRDPLNFNPKVTMTIEWNPADLVYRSNGNTQIMDFCDDCGSRVRQFIHSKIYELSND